MSSSDKQAAVTPDRAVSFTASTVSGENVVFPAGYAGKLVLLDFWATWCGPCRVEIPHLTRAYSQYHDRGLEVLGITLDRSADQAFKTFLGDHKMTWEQIHAGGSEIATKYGVTAIPAAFLIDADTGAILASGNDLHGSKLAATIEKHLAAKKK